MKPILFTLTSLFIFNTIASAATDEQRRQVWEEKCAAQGKVVKTHRRSMEGLATYYGNEFIGEKMGCEGFGKFSQGGNAAAIRVDLLRSGLFRCGMEVQVTRKDLVGRDGQPLSTKVVIGSTGGMLGPRSGRLIDLPTSRSRQIGFGPPLGGTPPVELRWTAFSCVDANSAEALPRKTIVPVSSRASYRSAAR